MLEELTRCNCDITAIGAVRLEFLSKSRSKEELAKKLAFYNSALTSSEMTNRTFEHLFNDPALIYAFGKQANSFKAIDFMITAALKRYATKTLVLTNDHNDFTTQLFDLQDLIPLAPAQGSIIPFGLYSFSEEKYAALISQ